MWEVYEPTPLTREYLIKEGYIDGENVTVIDNFLFEEYFRDLHNIMMGNEFPWYYNDFITYDPAITPDLAESSESMFQYIHNFFFYKTQPTDSFYLICPLLECLTNV